MNRIILNETSYFGYNSRSVLKEEIIKRGFKKALVVTDRGSVKTSIPSMITKVLDDANLEYAMYDGVKPNPTVDNVKEEDITWLATQAYNDVCTPGNPRKTSIEEIKEIYKEAF